jgi:hypothetical protein
MKDLREEILDILELAFGLRVETWSQLEEVADDILRLIEDRLW